MAAVALAACFATRPIEWAPDGTHLAVAYGGQLYLIAADGTGVTRVTTGSVISDGPGAADVSWSPDGHEVAFTRGDDVWIADIANGAELRLAAGTHPAWSSDGRWVAYTVGETSERGWFADIWITDPGGTSAPRHLGRAAAMSGDGVDWAGDGTRVAACSNEGLVVFGLADRSRRDITIGDGGCAGSPDWSSDGRLVIAERGGLAVLSPDFGSTTVLTTTEPADGFGDRDPSWSPDGRRIAFTRSTGPALVDVSSGTVTDLGLADGEHPVWSPDGQTLAFVTWDEPNGAVYLVRDGQPASAIALSPRPRVERAGRGSTEVLVLPRGAALAGAELVMFPRPLPAAVTLGVVALDAAGIPSVTFTVPDVPSGRYELYLRGGGGDAWVAELLVMPEGGLATGVVAIAGWLAAVGLVLAGGRGAVRRRSRAFVVGGSVFLAGSVLVAGLAYPALLMLAAGLGSNRFRDVERAHTTRGNVLASIGALATCGFVCLGLVAGLEPKPSGEFTFLEFAWSGFGLAHLGLVVLVGGVTWHAAYALYKRDGKWPVEAAGLVVSLTGLVVLLGARAHAGEGLWPAIVVIFAAATLLHAVRPTNAGLGQAPAVRAEAS